MVTERDAILLAVKKKLCTEDCAESMVTERDAVLLTVKK